MKSTFILILILLCGVIKTQAAVSYPDLSIEERAVAIKDLAEKTLPQEKTQTPDSALEEEKKLIAQQLTIITGDEDTRYVIVTGDTLKVVYKDGGELTSSVFQVNAQGEIAMPLIGNVKVAGLNRGEARALLNQKVTDYIRDPQLTVEINTSGKYIVMGASGPGVFNLQPDLSLMDAIIKAGYDSHRANLANVLVMRGGREKPEIIRLNLKKMMLKGDRSDNIAVKPNDLIYVPNTLFFDIDSFRDKVFSYIADYYTLGGYTILNHTSKSSSTGATTTP
jgi:polysaccharide export outer membrane protein